MSAQSIDRYIDLKSWDAHRQAEQVIAALAADFPGLIEVGRPFEPVPYPTRRHPVTKSMRKPIGPRTRLAADDLFRVVPREEVRRILGFGPNTCLLHNWGNWVPTHYEAWLRDLMRHWPRLSKARDMLLKGRSRNDTARELQLSKTELSDQLREFRMDVPHVV